MTSHKSDVRPTSLVETAAEWPSLQGLVRIEAERYHKATGKTESQTRYYITSLKPDAGRLNRAVRQHWGIENKLHLGARCRLRRRPRPQTAEERCAELLPAQPHRPQSSQTRHLHQTRNQGQTSQSRLGQ